MFPVHHGRDTRTSRQFGLSNYTNGHILSGRDDEKTHTDMESMWAPGLVSTQCHSKVPNERIISNICAADVSSVVIRSVKGMAASRILMKCQERYRVFQPIVDHMVQPQCLKFTPRAFTLVGARLRNRYSSFTNSPSSKYSKQLLFAQKENAGWLLIKVWRDILLHRFFCACVFYLKTFLKKK